MLCPEVTLFLLCFCFPLQGSSKRQRFDSGFPYLPLPEIDYLSEDFVKHHSSSLIHNSLENASDEAKGFHPETLRHQVKKKFRLAREIRPKRNTYQPYGSMFIQSFVHRKSPTGAPPVHSTPYKSPDTEIYRVGYRRPNHNTGIPDDGLKESGNAYKTYKPTRGATLSNQNYEVQPQDIFNQEMPPLARYVMREVFSDSVVPNSCCNSVSEVKNAHDKQKQDIPFFGRRSVNATTEITLNDEEENDFSVGMISDCDFMDLESKTCWFEREVGDSLTLAVNVTAYHKGETSSVRWYRVYSLMNKEKEISIEILANRAPWNIVVGSGGTEFRLSPLTDTDMDPNSFMAKVYGMNQQLGKTAPKLLQQITFRINTVPIDMGILYPGEEVNINVDNYISLPEEGVSVLWSMEKSLSVAWPLPSNMKTSPTGRSLIIKELKRDQQGILSCTIYSSASIAVAKRRFKIQKPVEHLLKRSPNLLEAPSSNAALNGLQNSIRNPKSRRFLKREKKSTSHIRRKRVKRVVSMDKHGRYHLEHRTKDNEESNMNRLEKYLRKRSHLFRDRNSRNVKPQNEGIVTKITVGRPGLKEASDTEDYSQLNLGLRNDSERDTGQQNVDFDDLISKEVHYVTVRSVLITHGPQERSMTFEERESFPMRRCYSNADCGSGATCIIPEEGYGYCICREDHHGNGLFCYVLEDDAIIGNPRHKRIKRHHTITEANQKSDEINGVLFYGSETPDGKDLPQQNGLVLQSKVPDLLPPMYEKTSNMNWEQRNPPSRSVYFDDEESYLLSPCEDDKLCSQHAWCTKPVNGGHSYCKCKSGYRGNGMFCWEDINNVPSREFAFGKERVPQISQEERNA